MVDQNIRAIKIKAKLNKKKLVHYRRCKCHFSFEKYWGHDSPDDFVLVNKHDLSTSIGKVMIPEMVSTKLSDITTTI